MNYTSILAGSRNVADNMSVTMSLLSAKTLQLLPSTRAEPARTHYRLFEGAARTHYRLLRELLEPIIGCLREWSSSLRILGSKLEKNHHFFVTTESCI